MPVSFRADKVEPGDGLRLTQADSMVVRMQSLRRLHKGKMGRSTLKRNARNMNRMINIVFRPHETHVV